MFISKLTVPLNNRQAILLFSDRNKIHGELTRLVGGEDRPLFSRHPSSDGVGVINVISQKEIPWEPNQKYSFEQKEVFLRFPAGMRLNFRLNANPTKRPRVDGSTKKRESIQPIFGVENLTEWLSERLIGAADIIYCDVQWGAPERIWQKQMLVHSVFFEGQIEVIDSDVLLGIMINGIGREKFLGFGLLEVFPA